MADDPPKPAESAPALKKRSKKFAPKRPQNQPAPAPAQPAGFATYGEGWSTWHAEYPADWDY